MTYGGESSTGLRCCRRHAKDEDLDVSVISLPPVMERKGSRRALLTPGQQAAIKAKGGIWVKAHAAMPATAALVVLVVNDLYGQRAAAALVGGLPLLLLVVVQFRNCLGFLSRPTAAKPGQGGATVVPVAMAAPPACAQVTPAQLEAGLRKDGVENPSKEKETSEALAEDLFRLQAEIAAIRWNAKQQALELDAHLRSAREECAEARRKERQTRKMFEELSTEAGQAILLGAQLRVMLEECRKAAESQEEALREAQNDTHCVTERLVAAEVARDVATLGLAEAQEAEARMAGECRHALLRLEQAQEEKVRLQETCEEALRQSEQAVSRNPEMEAEFQQAKQQLQKLQQQLDDAKEEQQRANRLRQEAQAEVVQIRGDLSLLQRQKQELAESAEESRRLCAASQAEGDSATELLMALSSETTSLRQKVAELERQAAEEERRRGSQTKWTSKLATQLTTLQEQHDELQRKNDKVERELQQERDDMAQRRRDLRRAMEAWQKERQRAERLEGQLTEAGIAPRRESWISSLTRSSTTPDMNGMSGNTDEVTIDAMGSILQRSIFSVPQDLRATVKRQLLLCFHPDRNPATEVATRITQILNSTNSEIPS